MIIIYPQRILLSYNSTIIRSEDGGVNWEAVLSTPVTLDNIEQSPANPEVTYTSFFNTLYRSSDFGSSWEEMTLPESMGSIQDLAAAGGNLHAACSDGQHIYDSGTEEWTWENIGIPGGMTWSLHAGQEGGFPLFASTGFWLNEGQFSWEAATSPPYGHIEHISYPVESPNIWFAAGEYG